MVIKRTTILVSILITLFLAMAVSASSSESTSILSGNSIKETIKGFYETSSVNERITLLSEVILVIALFIVIFIIIKKIRSKKGLSKVGLVQKKNVKYRTDLDTLYEMLKREKQISIEDIEKTFKVDSDVAFDWSKILENGNLAIIDYPRFGKPVLKLVEENAEAESEKSLEDEEEKGAENKKVKKTASTKVQKGAVVAEKTAGGSKAKKGAKKKKKVEKKSKRKHSAKTKKKIKKKKR